MPVDQWTRIQDLFLEASALEAKERADFLDRETGGNATLRRVVESLLSASDQTGGFLTKALGDAALTAVESRTPREGDRFGAYVWRRALGQGGMGSVFLAERADGAYQKQVAIKVVRAAFDTASARSRFRSERQILAQLEHPNIARLLEGGETGEGLPYVVMEFIDGMPVDRFCRERALPLEARLAIFRQVCAAVSYAHRNLVVHRDLKPDNILVTRDGVPKLVDFGIAKLIESGDGSTTQMEERALTLNYASPEQVMGRRITAASDVYSLGVVLYELLAGQRPYELGGLSPAVLEKTVCEEDPPPPSRVAGEEARRLQGDLDRITAKAMRKDPALRYESADALSADLERYLNGYPVQAAALSAGYRLRKFVLRHRWGVAAGALACVAVTGFVFTLIEQRNRADRERAKAEQVARLLVQSFEAAAPATAKGRVVTARDILDAGASRIDKELKSQPGLQATMLRTLAEVYADIGESKRALELVERAVQRRGGDEADRAGRVRDAVALGRITYEAGNGEKAMLLLEKARELQRKLTPDDLELRGGVQTSLASVYTLRANFAGAEEALKDAIDVRRRLGDEVKLAESLGELAHVYLYLGRYREAVGLLRNAHEIGTRRNGEMDAQALFHAMLLSNCLQGAGEDAEAVRWGEYALERLRKIYGDRRQIGPALTVLATAYRRVERLEDSRRLQELNLEILRRENAVNSIPSGVHMVAVSHYFLGQHAEFRRLFSEGLKQARALGTASGQQGLYYGIALRQQGDLAPALFELQWARDSEVRSSPPNHPGRAGYHIQLAAVLMDLRMFQEAEQELAIAQQLQSRALRPGHYLLDYVDILRADCRLNLGDPAEARRLGERAALALPGKHRSAEAVAASFLGRLALAEGDSLRATSHLQRAAEMEQRPSRYHDVFSRALTEASLAQALRQAGRVEEAGRWTASAVRTLDLYPLHPRLHAAVREIGSTRGAVPSAPAE